MTSKLTRSWRVTVAAWSKPQQDRRHVPGSELYEAYMEQCRATSRTIVRARVGRQLKVIELSAAQAARRRQRAGQPRRHWRNGGPGAAAAKFAASADEAGRRGLSAAQDALAAVQRPGFAAQKVAQVKQAGQLLADDASRRLWGSDGSAFFPAGDSGTHGEGSRSPGVSVRASLKGGK